MKSSPKKSRPSTSSPQKSPAKAVATVELDQLHDEVKQLQFTVGDRDVEIERMKTTLVALNHKLAALSDIQKEVEDHKSFLKTSEGERGNQQTYLVELSQKIRIESDAHETKHDQSLKEMESLRRDIQDLKQQLADRENEHLKMVEKINQDHFQELAQKDEYQKRKEQEHNDKLAAQEQKHLDRVKELQSGGTATMNDTDREHQAELRQLDKEKTQREQDYIAKTRDQ